MKPGPKPLLTDEILQEVKQELTLKSMNFKSVRVEEGGEYTLMQMIYTAIQSKQTNTIARLREFDYKTKKSWVDRLGIVVRAGSVKSSSRQGALSIRQELSYAAGYNYLFGGGLHYEAIIHTDDTSVMLFPMETNKVQVVTTKEAIAWLEAHNLSVSTTNEKHFKQRLFTIKTSVSYAGLVCVVYYVYDREFLIYKDSPSILPMGNQRYVVLAHPLTDPVKLEAMVQILCVEEEGEKLR